MATLVDSSVLLDITGEDPTWFDWSSSALRTAAERGQLVINPIVFAEVSARYERIEDIDHYLADFVREPLPWTAAFLAAKAHANHRRRGGSRRSVLPDFFIGAHAAVAGHALVTRDAARVRTYFPRVDVIAPEPPG